MSELLQPGQHPDADQLNAFVEHALPQHEHQQTLAHLAICPDCRTIVSLSLPTVEESPVPEPEPARKPWFSGWNLAWPAAAALAGLVVILYVRNAATTRSSTAGTQVAISQLEASLAVSEASTVPAPTLFRCSAVTTGLNFGSSASITRMKRSSVARCAI